MNKLTTVFCVVVALSIPLTASALELLSPLDDCTLTEERVRVVGSGPDGERGKISFGGRETSFRVKNGRFTTALNLGQGTHEVTFTLAGETLVANWIVAPKAGKGAYEYHPRMDKRDECSACHEETVTIEPDSDVGKICSRCHSKMDEKRYVHGPTAMGMCSACHDPHGSIYPTYLRYDPETLCVECHNQPITGEHTAQAGDDLCTDCHNPHQSDKKFLLE